jgi:hypothetical protein
MLRSYLTAASAASAAHRRTTSGTGAAARALALGAAGLSAAATTLLDFGNRVLISGFTGKIVHYIIEKDFIYKNCVP